MNGSHAFSRAWSDSFRHHLAPLPRASYRPPIVRGGGERVIVALAPWLYSAEAYADEVHRAHAEATVVALPQPFRQPSGREWFAYEDEEEEKNEEEEEGGRKQAERKAEDATNESLMRRLGLCANLTEVRASIAAVCGFLQRVRAAEIVLVGTSQGGSVAAHVGAHCRCAALRACWCHQPAGFYTALWRLRRDVVLGSEVIPGEHGDPWDGRLPAPRSDAARALTLSFGARDRTAPRLCGASSSTHDCNNVPFPRNTNTTSETQEMTASEYEKKEKAVKKRIAEYKDKNWYHHQTRDTQLPPGGKAIVRRRIAEAEKRKKEKPQKEKVNQRMAYEKKEKAVKKRIAEYKDKNWYHHQTRDTQLPPGGKAIVRRRIAEAEKEEGEGQEGESEAAQRRGKK